MTALQFRVSGLTDLDRVEIEEELSKQFDGAPPGSDERGLIAFEEEPAPDGTFGEPVTLTIVVGAFALRGLAIWLGRRTKPDIFEGEFEVDYPDGTRRKCKVKFIISKDRPISDQVLEQLSTVSGLSLAQLDPHHAQ